MKNLKLGLPKKRVVIKLGGSALNNPSTLLELAALVKSFQKKRYNVVLVHGGGPAINQELTKRGITWKFVEGQRQTTSEMMDVIEETLAVKVNGAIVETLREAQINAIGLSGAKHNVLSCEQLSEELMQVGKVVSVDTTAITKCFDTIPSHVPVIAPIGIGAKKFNINADWAATQIAMALGARKLIFLTDQTGILDGDKQLVKKVNTRMIEKMIAEGVISGGMCAKVRAMTAALAAGVKQVRVLHASNASQLHTALPNEECLGTLLTETSSLTHAFKEALHVRAG